MIELSFRWALVNLDFARSAFQKASCSFGKSLIVTGREFIAEAERLARPCILLRPTGSEDRLAGFWGGPRRVPSIGERFRHWLTFDCRFMPNGLAPSNGCLSVYTDEKDCISGNAVHDPSAELLLEPGSIKLFAHEARSLPPVEAVFRFGSSAVHRWLQSRGWQPEWGYNGNFSDAKPVCEYESLFRSEHPLYAGGSYAVLGGWHFPWPDGDWEHLLGRPLLACTFEDSEPWVELWGGDQLEVKQRIT